MSYITCENLILGYEGTPVADHISFSVEKGDYLCCLLYTSDAADER